MLVEAARKIIEVNEAPPDCPRITDSIAAPDESFGVAEVVPNTPMTDIPYYSFGCIGGMVADNHGIVPVKDPRDPEKNPILRRCRECPLYNSSVVYRSTDWKPVKDEG